MVKLSACWALSTYSDNPLLSLFSLSQFVICICFCVNKIFSSDNQLKLHSLGFHMVPFQFRTKTIQSKFICTVMNIYTQPKEDFTSMFHVIFQILRKVILILLWTNRIWGSEKTNTSIWCKTQKHFWQWFQQLHLLQTIFECCFMFV